ncbi:hypothetical protein LCGC14_0572210 [marine sediment metagenome]|uniref:Uncharacterized protein n=1 Tax=marine sediment metagenome TaxID=412755 RepID=A0A0F9US34_9ZZZZ
MSKRSDKPTTDEILKEFEFCKKHYSNLRQCYEDDERFYNLDFKDRLHIPKEFEKDRVVLPTARDVVDTGINHTNIFNARVFTNKKGTSEISKESAEMLRKLGLGIIHGINVESRIAPAHVGAKHYWKHGLAVFKTIWDADRWVDKPEQKDGESDDDYAVRLDDWRAGQHLSLPIVIKAINPYHIMPDPYTGGDYYVIEWYKRKLYDVKRIWPHYEDKEKRDPDTWIETFSFWTDKYRAEFVVTSPEGESIKGDSMLKLPGGVVAHKYGFNPYTLIESGLGDEDTENKPENRYVGLLRKMNDLLVSESLNYSLHNILMTQGTLGGGYVTGVDAGTVGEVKKEYGKYWPVGGKDVEFHEWESKVPSEASARHLALTHDYISSHAAPRSARGLSEVGVRSGADRRLIIAEASAIYQYATPAFQNGWAQILSKCAMLVKNVIPGDFRIWTKTPTDEFDVLVKKKLIREPFNYYVEFAPISEEDEYRRQDSLLKMWNGGQGITTQEWTWNQMSNVDPERMRREQEKENLRRMPSYNQLKDQTLAMLYQQALQQLGLQGQAAPAQQGAQQGQGQAQGQRPMVPGIPNRAPMGSAQDIDNQLRKLVEQGNSGIQSGQGLGGGGNR